MNHDLRYLITRYLKDNIPSNESVALLYSGGYESFACLCSLLDIGIKPRLYTFSLKGVISKDLQKARHDAKFFNLELVECYIPNDYKSLKETSFTIIKEWGTSRKTVVQCLHPLYYTIPKISECVVVSGLEKGNLWGDTKNGAIAGSRSKEDFDEYRLHEALKDEKGSTSFFDKYLIREGKMSIRPFGDEKIFLWFLSKDYFELNKPHHKNAIFECYKKEIEALKSKPKTANYQIESGIKEFHDLLLDDKELNPNHQYKSVVGVYNNIQKLLNKEETLF